MASCPEPARRVPVSTGAGEGGVQGRALRAAQGDRSERGTLLSLPPESSEAGLGPAVAPAPPQATKDAKVCVSGRKVRGCSSQVGQIGNGSLNAGLPMLMHYNSHGACSALTSGGPSLL